MMMEDERMIRRAIEIAEDSKKQGNAPFGALLVKDGVILMEEGNQVHTKNDPTHHAELALIRRFCRETGTRDLGDYTLYTSCEPCVMCAGALVFTGIGRLIYSASNKQMAEKTGGGIMISSKEVFKASPHHPVVKGKVLNEEGIVLFE
ncbi:nucleoside deaminase [Halobacillus litoralis]|uniref:nucleoside deaminase n=1 Tax=Halobacillus litoralis TaxID=45668 RepID=UPI00136FD7E9|nr:nucleoside deaminase [Halobacillus litoralis]MYL39400.1 nucleoside deaminase [Halobacillus litoralis]